MPLLNYTTGVESIKTVGEIQAMLAKAKATRIMLDYEDGEPGALTFQLHGNPYQLPCRWQAVQKLLRSDLKEVAQRGVTDARARRIAWRIIKDWVEAQLALIQTGMVDADEVFLPYQIVTKKGETLYTVYLRNDRLLPLREDSKP